MEIIKKDKLRLVSGSITGETYVDKIRKVKLNIREHRAYSIYKLGKEMGFSPNDILARLKKNELSGKHIRIGIKAYQLERQGYEIIGDSAKFMSGFKKSISRELPVVTDLPWGKIDWDKVKRQKLQTAMRIKSDN